VGLLKDCNGGGERLDFACTKGQSETGNIAVDSFFPALLDFNRKIKTIAVLRSAKICEESFPGLNLEAALCGFFMTVSEQDRGVLSKYSEEGDR
jgi:hypothetical protein